MLENVVANRAEIDVQGAVYFGRIAWSVIGFASASEGAASSLRR